MNKFKHAQYELEPERLRKILPDSPGVYCYMDQSGRVVYVGKAKNLRKRVLSYFRPRDNLSDKTAIMMKKAKSLDIILTSTEQEAFILESSLIKKYMPRYNIILRDDKQYPCLRLNIKDVYPRLSIVRRIKKDGAVYFGPFSSSSSVRSTYRLIDRVFKLRKCKGMGLPKRTRPCLNYQMGRCLAPCIYKIPEEKYNEIVKQVRLFLDGRNSELIRHLKKDMVNASEQLDFENAAIIRDQLRAIEKTVERQNVVSRGLEDQDILGLLKKENLFQLVCLYVRKGYMVGSRNYFFNVPGDSSSEVMESFIKQYYSREVFIPEKILISETIDDLVPVTEWLGALAGKKIVIHRPLRGEKLRLVNLAVLNAENLLAARKKFQDEDLMKFVQQHFNLNKTPRFIEGMDISNIQGDMAVGSIVSFVDGLPHKPGYRNFRIKKVEGIDDYGMMTELVQRRVAHEQLPDLFLVDGGKGHLSCVKSVLNMETPAGATNVVSIAKPNENRHEKHDKIYLPDRKNPLSLRSDHPVLLLMMRIRDEAHRRAISYHRKLRAKKLTGSELDEIPGIGAKRRTQLLRHFGDVNAVAAADLKALLDVPGINKEIASNIQLFFEGKRCFGG